ncbi:hypothetical protein WJX77_008205 [Trebouxia sp. C0004]
MSRRLILGVQRVLCQVPAELLPEVQCATCVQGAVSNWQSLAALKQFPRGSRPFAASVCQSQSQAAQASITTEPASPPDWSEASQEQDVPAEQYSHSGRITGPYVVTPKPVFAVVELGPTQFKVTPDDLVYSEKLKGVDVGDELSLNRVLLLGNAKTTVIGRPCIPGAKVMAVVEEQFLNGKVLIFKKRRRKNSRRLNGHRQELTGLRITDVHGLEAAAQGNVQ